ncbi:MAG: DUF2817 domain-containing protein [Candidatus Nanoarchaeia archaeon]|nr:DUF2817 domain-containing protein [Candidatus Nanoarchaeia archaeon]
MVSNTHYTRLSLEKEKNMYVVLSAGIHGDETSGVFTLLEFLKKEVQKYGNKFTFHVYPCVNPTGFDNNNDTNYNEVNLNRDFVDAKTDEIKLIKKSLVSGPLSYEFAMDFHETGSGEEGNPDNYYLYEACMNVSKRIGNYIIDNVLLYVPVCKWNEIWGEPNSDGVIYYPENCRHEEYKEPTSFDSFLFKNYTSHSFTVELPGRLKLEDKVNAGLETIRTALKIFGNQDL